MPGPSIGPWEEPPQTGFQLEPVPLIMTLGSAAALNPPPCPLIQPTVPEFACENIVRDCVEGLEVEVEQDLLLSPRPSR